MKLVHTQAELTVALQINKGSIGFVPTMGALHAGHASLLRRSKKENTVSVLSIFINPTQFGPNEDLLRYPRTLEADLEVAREDKADIVYVPTVEEIYPPGFSSFIEVGAVAQPFCGAFRPGHFRGVATVVARFFGLVKPTRAYFGEKDIQQCLVIQRMVHDLALSVELVFCPTLREADGLAMSSRNRYLTNEEREVAPQIYKTLVEVKEKIQAGEKSVEKLLLEAQKKLSQKFKLQYMELRSYPDLSTLETVNGKCVLAVAAYLGPTRLIDNILI